MKRQLGIFLAIFMVMGMGPRPDGKARPSTFQRETIGAPTLTLPEQSGRALTILGAAEATPRDFLWQARPLVVFADTGADPAFADQMAALTAQPAPLLARDVVVITDTDPKANGPWRQMLRPEGFSLILIDKDGQVKQRKPVPWSVREITRAIDKFPLRIQEIGRAGVLD